jgi:hypothetical protein
MVVLYSLILTFELVKQSKKQIFKYQCDGLCFWTFFIFQNPIMPNIMIITRAAGVKVASWYALDWFMLYKMMLRLRYSCFYFNFIDWHHSLIFLNLFFCSMKFFVNIVVRTSRLNSSYCFRKQKLSHLFYPAVNWSLSLLYTHLVALNYFIK